MRNVKIEIPVLLFCAAQPFLAFHLQGFATPAQVDSSRSSTPILRVRPLCGNVPNLPIYNAEQVDIGRSFTRSRVIQASESQTDVHRPH